LVKKETFEWKKTGKKNIELRKRKAKQGDTVVFQCETQILKGKITKKEEGNLTAVSEHAHSMKLFLAHGPLGQDSTFLLAKES
jgi:hypothetical protein